MDRAAGYLWLASCNIAIDQILPSGLSSKQTGQVEKGNSVERQGRKATDLRERSYDGGVTNENVRL